MPNGGIPMFMALYPKRGDLVFFCEGSELRLVPRDEWAEHKSRAKPVCVLDVGEAFVLAAHLAYWLGYEEMRRSGARQALCKVEYDY